MARAVPGTRGLTTHAVEAIPLRPRTGSALWLCVGVGSNAAGEKEGQKLEFTGIRRGGLAGPRRIAIQQVDDSQRRQGVEMSVNPPHRQGQESCSVGFGVEPPERSLRDGMGVCTQCSGRTRNPEVLRDSLTQHKNKNRYASGVAFARSRCGCFHNWPRYDWLCQKDVSNMTGRWRPVSLQE